MARSSGSPTRASEFIETALTIVLAIFRLRSQRNWTSMSVNSFSNLLHKFLIGSWRKELLGKSKPRSTFENLVKTLAVFGYLSLLAGISSKNLELSRRDWIPQSLRALFRKVLQIMKWIA